MTTTYRKIVSINTAYTYAIPIGSILCLTDSTQISWSSSYYHIHIIGTGIKYHSAQDSNRMTYINKHSIVFEPDELFSLVYE